MTEPMYFHVRPLSRFLRLFFTPRVQSGTRSAYGAFRQNKYNVDYSFFWEWHTAANLTGRVARRNVFEAAANLHSWISSQSAPLGVWICMWKIKDSGPCRCHVKDTYDGWVMCVHNFIICFQRRQLSPIRSALSVRSERLNASSSVSFPVNGFCWVSAAAMLKVICEFESTMSSLCTTAFIVFFCINGHFSRPI